MFSTGVVSGVLDEDSVSAGGSSGGDPGGSTGEGYPSSPVTRAGYSGGYTFTPGQYQHGSAYTYTPGTWTEGSGNRDPTTGNTAKMNFAGGRRWTAGRIDGSDKFSLNENGHSKNMLILTGSKVRTAMADMAVFPGEAGPHPHTHGTCPQDYWTVERLRNAGIGDGSGATYDAAIASIIDNSQLGRRLNAGIIFYWPQIDTPPVNNNGHTGYIGIPRKVAWVPSNFELADGVPVHPFPQGLRLVSFRTSFARHGSEPYWKFTVQFPSCWDGVNLWLPPTDDPFTTTSCPGHLRYLRDDGTPPPSHPYVLPQIHWFVTTTTPWDRPRPKMSSEYPEGGNIIPHAEALWAGDPIMTEAVAWMCNNRYTLGRLYQD